MKSKPGNLVKQFVCYILGLLVITIGINISKMSVLGISPVSSIPRACEQIWGFTLGVTTMIIYIFLVLAQLIILRKDFKLRNALGIVLTFVFSAMIDLTGTDPKAFGDCKMIVDTSMIVIALILQLLFLGGLHSFAGEGVVVREGTVIAAIFVGQVVKILSKNFAKPLEGWLHAGEAKEQK